MSHGHAARSESEIWQERREVQERWMGLLRYIRWSLPDLLAEVSRDLAQVSPDSAVDLRQDYSLWLSQQESSDQSTAPRRYYPFARYRTHRSLARPEEEESYSLPLYTSAIDGAARAKAMRTSSTLTPEDLAAQLDSLPRSRWSDGRVDRSTGLAQSSPFTDANHYLRPTIADSTADWQRNTETDQALALLLPLLILLSSLLFLLLLFLIFLIVARRRRGIALQDDDGPLDVGQEEELSAEGGFTGVEQRWLESVDDGVKTGYFRAKAWQAQYPPNSQPSDITLSQFLSIQEKGISAWCFEPDYEANSPCVVHSRTEITFEPDGLGMTPEEGGGCCVQSNLPLPKLNEVYYWECKLFAKPADTIIAVGLSTKPYPCFRLPGWNKYSIGYFSNDGFKCHNQPFSSQSYGPPLLEGDVIGIGYRPRTGAVFFTRNGKKLEDAYIGLNRYNLFPTVGADGAATIHVNLGQAGFVFIEANVKKWGLAPTIGTLAPPPAYGSERGSILLEAGQHGQNVTPTQLVPPSRIFNPQQSTEQPSTSNSSVAILAPTSPANPQRDRRHRQRSHRSQGSEPNWTAPVRPSPLRTTLRPPSASSGSSSIDIPLDQVSPTGSGLSASEQDSEEDYPQNPPTPNRLDISLHALGPLGMREAAEEAQEQVRDGSRDSSRRHRRSRTTSQQTRESDRRSNSPSPPSYHPIDQNMYPSGVAEAMLEDAFGSTGAPASLSAYESRNTSAQAPSTNSEGRGIWGMFSNRFARPLLPQPATASPNQNRL